MNNETYKLYQHCLNEAEVFGDVLRMWEDSTGTLEEDKLREMLEENPWSSWMVEDTTEWLLLARELSLHLEVNGF